MSKGSAHKRLNRILRERNKLANTLVKDVMAQTGGPTPKSLVRAAHTYAAKTITSKGQKNGICGRTACDVSGRTVIFHNHVTAKYYCPRCAHAINEGHAEPLCVAER